MSNSQVIFSPITGLSTINSDNVLTNGLSSVEQDTELIKIDVMDNFNSAFVTLKSTIIPDVTNSYTLGTTLLRFSDIYTEILDATAVNFTNLTVTGGLDVDGLTTLDQVTINTTDGDFKVWDGATSLIVVDTSIVTLSGTYVDVENIRFSGSNIGLTTDTNLLSLENDQLNVNGDINLVSGQRYEIDNISILTNNTLGSSVLTSSLTTVGALDSGSISSGFGNFDNGSSTLSTGNITCNAITSASDIILLKDTANSNRLYRLGTNNSNHLNMQCITVSDTTDLDYILMRTISDDAGANKGLIRYEIDDIDVCDINDSGINLFSGKEYLINDTSVLSSTVFIR